MAAGGGVAIFCVNVVLNSLPSPASFLVMLSLSARRFLSTSSIFSASCLMLSCVAVLSPLAFNRSTCSRSEWISATMSAIRFCCVWSVSCNCSTLLFMRLKFTSISSRSAAAVADSWAAKGLAHRKLPASNPEKRRFHFMRST